jgi:hypothetical protein
MTLDVDTLQSGLIIPMVTVVGYTVRESQRRQRLRWYLIKKKLEILFRTINGTYFKVEG